MGTATVAANVSPRRSPQSSLRASPSRSTSPSLEADADVDPVHMTFDELEMQRSRHFVQALKELKNLRPQLYSAAEYCESSYLYSDQKQVVLDNLKDYSVKALVNAVDHLGTVAYKLNDLLGQQTTEISATELRAASVAQRMRSCQEHSDREGLKQQSLAKTMHANHKHYVLPDPCAEGELNLSLVRENFDSVHSHMSPLKSESHPLPTPQMQPQPLAKDYPTDFASSSGSKSLAWHFTSETAPTSTSEGSTSSKRSISTGRRTPPPTASGRRVLEASLSKDNGDSMPRTSEAGLSTSKYPESIKLSTQRSGSFTPAKTAPTRGAGFSRSSTMIPTHAVENGANDSKSTQARSKSLLRSLLGRKSTKTTGSKPA
ncbi:uncharacterized protein [Physcomitrium patens]|uniref:uncharacterized protein isoform X2 n=1 Tax=Physcomitrium patens TaxID=3218 RepID=UPI000D159343|nr:protein ABIL1-like isoform X2 [Physcomitrium patens]|eukprot:XP_024394235.1 protein ABIL1-like isoform X2 [Physcomitrella patens]